MSHQFSAFKRRDVLIGSGIGFALLILPQCVTRGGSKTRLFAADFEPPRRPLRSAEGFPVRYHMRQNPTQDIVNLLAVYSHVYQIMLSAVPASQATTLQIERTPGKLQQFLPQASRENWESFSWWSQAEIHFNNCPHGSENFVLWHRAFIFHFEKIARSIARAIVVDSESGRQDAEKLKTHKNYYTDWTIPVFHWSPEETLPAVFFDTNEFPQYPDNPDIGLGNTRAVQPGSRQNATDSPWASFIDVSKQTLEKILGVQDIVSFSGGENFTSLLEAAPHNGIHTWIGAQMNAFFSPLDPLFYCHHAMVDFLFEEWLIRRRNEGMKSADFLPGILARDSQLGFMDIDTGSPTTVPNTVLVESEKHGITYEELSARVSLPVPQRSAGSNNPLALGEDSTAPKLRPSGSGIASQAAVERIVIDEFSGQFYVFEEELDGAKQKASLQNGKNPAKKITLLRAQLKVKEQAAVVAQAATLLDQIVSDLRNPDPLAKKYVSSVHLRFENIGVAIEDRFSTTLQIKIRKKGFKPFLESSYAIFARFGSTPKPSFVESYQALMRKKMNDSPDTHEEHHQNHHRGEGNSYPGLMVDLVPVLADLSIPSFDFVELLSSDTFWVDFRLARRAANGDYSSSALPEKLAATINQKLKISLVVQAKKRA